ncbi:MAG: bifunctional hydroxymethylpyrimidine kinase/phosphomethylpyrimidine kinase [Deltaproteobacteria bacterium]
MVLAIAGSDPSGGAGVQADIKTCAIIGVYCGAAVTCVTVQNTRGVQAFVPLAPRLVKQQIDAVLNDMPVTHVKIGMVGSAAIAEAIASALADFSGEIICDPVLTSSSGTALIAEAELTAVCDNLYSRVTVLTPNLPELEALSRQQCSDEKSLLAAAEILFLSFPSLRVVVVKGGHIAPRQRTVNDYLFLSQRAQGKGLLVEKKKHPRIRSANTHGTGCTFASAYAAYHLKSGDDLFAFSQASNFVSQLVEKSVSAKLGAGHGPLLHHLLAGSRNENQD